MKRRRRRKCLACDELFRPDPRNVRHQRYCHAPACRKASKAASQRRWLDKPGNRDYFRGATHVARVQAWRNAQHGRCTNQSLQDHRSAQLIEKKNKTALLAAVSLQDHWLRQPFVLIGLIAHLTDLTLQDSIHSHLRRLEQLGRDIIHTGDAHEPSHTAPRAPATTAAPVQLDRPESGPP